MTDSNGNVFEDNPFLDIHTQGLLTGHTFTVSDIVYDRGAQARFLANDLSGVCGPDGCAPDGDIWGRTGRFEFQQTWDFVKLLNASSLNMVTNVIDVVNTSNSPLIDIRVDHIPPGTGTNTGGLGENSPAPSFDFDIFYKFPPSLVQVQNSCPFTCPARNPFIRLDGYIENPIGRTEISNASGDILSGPGREIIRTNILDLDAPHGNIGFQSALHVPNDTARNPIAVELVRFKHGDPEICPGGASSCLFEVQLTVDAGKDAVLDITTNRRTDDPIGSAMTVVIDHINAGSDVDVVINDSVNGNDQATIALVEVDMYNPGTKYYHFTFPTAYDPVLTDGSALSPCPGGACGNGSGHYETHFRPDGTLSGLEHILRALGTVGSEVDSTYELSAVRAGDDIDLCHVSVAGNGEPKTCQTSSVNDATHVVSDDTTPDTRVNITVNTDVAWSGGAPDGNDDEGALPAGVAQIFIRTNGDIVATELVGDMLVGSIVSTDGDVTLRSPRRILDADSRPTIDVAGRNLTLRANVDAPSGLGGIGRADGLPRDRHQLPGDRERRPQGVRHDQRRHVRGHLPRRARRRHAGLRGLHDRGQLAADRQRLAADHRRVDHRRQARRSDDNIRGQAVDLDANGGTHRPGRRRPRDRLRPRPTVRVQRPRGTQFSCGDQSNGTSDPALSTAGRRRLAGGQRRHLPDRDHALPPAGPRPRADRRHPADRP